MRCSPERVARTTGDGKVILGYETGVGEIPGEVAFTSVVIKTTTATIGELGGGVRVNGNRRRFGTSVLNTCDHSCGIGGGVSCTSLFGDLSDAT